MLHSFGNGSWAITGESTLEPPAPGAAEPLRVVIADDHPFYRENLAAMLRKSGIEVIREVPDGGAAVQAVEDLAPDVVVMDLRMRAGSGLEATRRLAESAPATRVLMLSVSLAEEDVLDAVLAGASGYVLKDRAVEDVVVGIRAAAAGHALISPPIAATLLRHVRELAGDGAELPGSRFSQLEIDLLDLLAEDRSDEEIGEVLAISPGSVRKHTASILMKLRAEHRGHQPGPE